jgi:hypothetical protein
MLQRVSLQTWQKLQSGQGFFLRRIIFPIFYINPFVLKTAVERACFLRRALRPLLGNIFGPGFAWPEIDYRA